MSSNTEITLCAVDNTFGREGPFSNLPILTNSHQLNPDFLEKWVHPFYMKSLAENDFQMSYAKIRKECSLHIAIELLGERNWRTRIVGAYFAAIERFIELEEAIGNLLLRSDLCFAGTGYCFALATFNTARSLQFLQDYLSYYLKQKELWFDQASVMAALAYLDRLNGTNNLTPYLPEWRFFTSNKSNWDLQKSIEGFAHSMNAIAYLRETT